MKSGSRANALLVELLLVIFFFAKLRSRTAEATNSSMLEAQNIAEDLYATDDPEAVLTEYGFTEQDGVWVQEKKGYTLKVTPRIEETESGLLH